MPTLPCDSSLRRSVVSRTSNTATISLFRPYHALALSLNISLTIVRRRTFSHFPSPSARFHRLNTRSINSFDSLKQTFLEHFMIQTDRLYSADNLYMLLQGEDEPLQEYAARFCLEYSIYPDTDNRAAFDAFKSGLRELNFCYLVHNNPWNTYAELMKQTSIHSKAKYFNSKHDLAN
ncbi:unnamed protein product [Prunus brigantina]